MLRCNGHPLPPPPPKGKLEPAHALSALFSRECFENNIGILLPGTLTHLPTTLSMVIGVRCLLLCTLHLLPCGKCQNHVILGPVLGCWMIGWCMVHAWCVALAWCLLICMSAAWRMVPGIRGGGGGKKIPGNGIQLFLRSQPPEGGGGYANFFLTHMTKNFTKQSRFKAKIVHVDLLTPSLHQCEDYGPGSTCKAW